MEGKGSERETNIRKQTKRKVGEQHEQREKSRKRQKNIFIDDHVVFGFGTKGKVRIRSFLTALTFSACREADLWLVNTHGVLTVCPQGAIT